MMGKTPNRTAPNRGKAAEPTRKVIPRRKRLVPGETKRERFIRIGDPRMSNALKHIKLLKPLSNTAEYDWTEHDASMMLAELRRAVDEVAEAFTPKPPSPPASQVKFSFVPERRH